VTAPYSETVNTARDYYNSEDADNFYFTIWGGEDIHVGLYKSEDEPIFDASRRTVETMAETLTNLSKDSRVLDIGAGYGGAARYLAATYGCEVVALNLSEVENERDRQMNKEQGLDHLITVVDASFENIPEPDESFDVVWSQDAILHSGEREKVIQEVARVLKPGGEFVFTDPMQADGAPTDVLQPIYDRISLSSMGSPSFYREAAKRAGLEEVSFTPRTEMIARHYGRVLKETESRDAEINEVVSREYIENMKNGLRHWINGGNNGHLVWGIFHFRRTK
jgi:sarcosine/dimethylglycine N-methyltransferase